MAAPSGRSYEINYVLRKYNSKRVIVDIQYKKEEFSNIPDLHRRIEEIKESEDCDDPDIVAKIDGEVTPVALIYHLYLVKSLSDGSASLPILYGCNTEYKDALEMVQKMKKGWSKEDSIIVTVCTTDDLGPISVDTSHVLNTFHFVK